MILADSSAWIEYLRRTGSRVHLGFSSAFEGEELAVTEVVIMELLSGIGPNGEERRVRRMISTIPLVRVGGLGAWEDAAMISRLCRDAGDAIAGRLDCLVAAVAIREKLPLMHADRDFDKIARHTTLTIAPV